MRTMIIDAAKQVRKQVELSGWIDVRRDHGKLIFLELRDRSGTIQMVITPKNKELHGVAQTLRPEWVVTVTGTVAERPENMRNKETPTGSVEIQVEMLTIIAQAKELPFDKDTKDINLDTYLDYLPLTLRANKQKAIFKVQSVLINAFRQFLTSQGFTEFQAPKLIGEDAEGGANSFNVEYFGHIAHLAQSPQLYKQIMVGVFERVFATGNVYRAEKHSTSRHLNEYTSLDIEMGFIKDHTDVMTLENELLAFMMSELQNHCAAEFALCGATIPEVPAQIPAMKLREAQEIIKNEYGIDCKNEPDLEPEHERLICDYAKNKLNSEFIFVTHFPISKRPFYTYEDEEDKGYAKGGDLLFRGVEITTLAQRIHDYDILVESMKKKNLDPAKFSFYLQAFKYGLPPHGGFGLGLERLTAKLLGVANVKEATLFPRDLNRIDHLLSQ